MRTEKEQHKLLCFTPVTGTFESFTLKVNELQFVLQVSQLHYSLENKWWVFTDALVSFRQITGPHNNQQGFSPVTGDWGESVGHSVGLYNWGPFNLSSGTKKITYGLDLTNIEIIPCWPRYSYHAHTYWLLNISKKLLKTSSLKSDIYRATAQDKTSLGLPKIFGKPNDYYWFLNLTD